MLGEDYFDNIPGHNLAAHICSRFELKNQIRIFGIIRMKQIFELFINSINVHLI